MLGNVPVAIVYSEPRCGNWPADNIVGDSFPLIVDPRYHLLYARWPRISVLGVLHPIRSLQVVNQARQTIFKRLEYSDVSCLQLRRQTSRNNHHIDLLADALRLDVIRYMRSHRVPHDPYDVAEV